jgi:hypothetical protein
MAREAAVRFMRLGSLLALSMGVALLAACDTLPNLRLHNGTGRPLDLKVTKGNQPTQSIHLEPGKAARIWNIYGPRFRLGVEGCDRLYMLPPMNLNFPWRLANGEMDYEDRYPVEVRLERDFTLSLLPDMPRARDGERPKQAVPIASHGFPLQPTPKACG